MRELPDKADLVIRRLGEATLAPPPTVKREGFVSSANDVLIAQEIGQQRRFLERGATPPVFEAGRAAREDLLRPGARRLRHRHLRRRLPRSQRRHPLHRADPEPRVRGPPHRRVSLRLPRALAREPVPADGADDRDGGEHPPARRDASRHVSRPAGSRPDDRPARRARPSGSLRGRRRRHAAGRFGARQGDRAPGPLDRRRRRPEDHRQRSPLDAAELRIRDRRGGSASRQ